MSRHRLAKAASLGPATAPSIHKLAGLNPQKLALIHGASFEANCACAPVSLADFYEERVCAAVPAGFTQNPAG
jgi:hypothetical protein